MGFFPELKIIKMNKNRINITDKALLINCTFYLLITINIFATEFDFRGQLSGWGNSMYYKDSSDNGTGVLYIPQFDLFYNLNNESFIGSELSFKGFIYTNFEESNQNIDFYRFNIRYATRQSETQIGLQKISFGPAMLLRSLMWFDQVDVRDPLRLTNGVYALRYKYNFLNNTNIWVWGLYGNKKKKGYEIFPTSDKLPEFGGRIQYPALVGELGQSFHYRKVEADSFNYDEYKFGFDGRWDALVGFWLEAAISYNSTEKLPFNWTKMFTVGADYTFDTGNGLYLLTEHFTSTTSNAFLLFNNNFYTSSFMLSYPLGILDNIRAICFYLHKNNNYYQFLDWQRTYDDFAFNISMFYYPESQASNLKVQTRGLGIQLMIIYNH
jgi:hypothetical protein